MFSFVFKNMETLLYVSNGFVLSVSIHSKTFCIFLDRFLGGWWLEEGTAGSDFVLMIVFLIFKKLEGGNCGSYTYPYMGSCHHYRFYSIHSSDQDGQITYTFVKSLLTYEFGKSA